MTSQNLRPRYDRHFVGKTLINVFHRDSAKIRFVSEIVSYRHFHEPTNGSNVYFHNTISLSFHPLAAHIMSCYTHKMAIVSWP